MTAPPLDDSGRVKLTRSRNGTKVKVRWSRQSVVGAVVRLTGVIEPSCGELRATLRADALGFRSDVVAVVSTCGDGIVDAARGEQCEPPGTGSCDAECQALCGGEPCCAGLQVRCNGVCTDVERNPEHCGVCGNACYEEQVCFAGACTCPAHNLICDGACIDPRRDEAHCGVCGNACDAAELCFDGFCTCPAENLICDGACVDPRLDEAHCGGCGRPCASGEACDGAICVAADGTPE